MLPIDGQAGSVIDNGYHNLNGTTQSALLFHFYTDPAFRNEIKGSLNVPFGNELYVKVVYDSQDSTMKMRVDTCTVFDQNSASQKLVRQIIHVVQNARIASNATILFVN
ncbi:hypothetical protein CHS0354_001587 [Potamilus streckersoni]|uniref:Uncharacterized protein n=1 Tax=Potamilus streckersoni TaxID=2493646 RepID=A0AAE0T1B8_9BIVA|nr:hypothetical protein CHS0354_001587 [Potamilus streckersoni]